MSAVSFLSFSNCPAIFLIVALHSALSSAACSYREWSIPACDICLYNWSSKRFLSAPRSRFPCFTSVQKTVFCILELSTRPSKLPQHQHTFYALYIGMLEHSPCDVVLPVYIRLYSYFGCPTTIFFSNFVIL